MIGQYFPIFLVGPVMSKFGKRVSLMIDSMLFTIGFLLMAFAVEVYMLYAAKFFMGKMCFNVNNWSLYVKYYRIFYKWGQ